MVTSAMGGRWTTNRIQYSCFTLLILVAQGCSSLNLDGLALLDFQARVSHDPYGAFASWDADDHDPCSWSHVHCVFGHVQALNLKGLSLEGVLTPELGNIIHLRRLVLSHNHFSGVIPKELGELKMLEVLDLRDNNLIGNIPPEIGRLQSLKSLLVYNNNLEGAIPPEDESFNLLYKLQFDDNLTFGVTDAIGNLNRKLGRCIWQGGCNQMRNADSLLSPIKETVINCFKPIQQFSKGILDNSCVSEESIPKLDRTELEAACEDFSNIIETMKGCMLFKGTLSSGVEICVAATTITRLNDWSKHAELAFRNKIDTLSRVNHKNFVNLIGYCEEDEPFVRMMVFEYAPNGSLSEHLHVQILERLDWSSRMRIIMGVAYCLQCMHELSPPVVQKHLNSKMIYLTDDYAAKVADMSFWREFYPKEKISVANESKHSVLPLVAEKETNIYSFGVLLLEIISGKYPYSDEQEPLVTWAEQFLNDKHNINHIIDPSLKLFDQNQLDVLCEAIQDCIQMDASQRPTINEIVPKLREVLGISPEQATPRLSPLWWAELEILSGEGT